MLMVLNMPSLERGYENIAHRKERRSRSAIGFSIELKTQVKEAHLLGTPIRGSAGQHVEALWTFRHSFEFKASGEAIRSDFAIVSERLEIIKEPLESNAKAERHYEWVVVARQKDGSLSIEGDLDSELMRSVLIDPKYWSPQAGSEFILAPSELVFTLPFFRPRVVGRFISWVTNLSIFQVSPDLSRHSGVPTPNPHMSARGENLPAVVDLLKRKHQKAWRSVLAAMRDIVPEIEDISLDYLHTRTLGLYFHERGVGRPWTAEEVSDGTIRALAMLVACFDPRISALLIEEPENSLHPWIIKEIVTHLRRLSAEKLVLVTTHSPVVINMLSPDEVWVIYKSGGETDLRRLVDFDGDLVSDWGHGKYRLFDYLESGFVPEAVPGG